MFWELVWLLKDLILQAIPTVTLFFYYEYLSKLPWLNLNAKRELLKMMNEGDSKLTESGLVKAAFREKYVANLSRVCFTLFLQLMLPSTNLLLVAWVIGFSEVAFFVQLISNSLLQVYVIDDYLLFFKSCNGQMSLILNYLFLVLVWNKLLLSVCT